jgi:hypothetical protein
MKPINADLCNLSPMIIKNEAYTQAKRFIELNCHQLEMADVVNIAKDVMNPDSVILLIGLEKACREVEPSLMKLLEKMPKSNRCYYFSLKSLKQPKVLSSRSEI